jgi:hypothetical protein
MLPVTAQTAKKRTTAKRARRARGVISRKNLRSTAFQTPVKAPERAVTGLKYSTEALDGGWSGSGSRR